MKSWKILIYSLGMIGNIAFASPQMIDKISVIINNSILLKSDIDNLFRDIILQAKNTGQTLPDNKTLRHQILENQIMNSIILQIAEAQGLKISDKQLNIMIKNIAIQNHLSVNQILDNVAYNGVHHNDDLIQIRKEILKNIVLDNEIRPRIVIFPQEIDTLIQQIGLQRSQDTQLHFSQIILPLPKNSTQQQINNQEELAYQLVQELKNDADFNKLLMLYSSNLKTVYNNQMGWKKISEMPTLLSRTLNTAKKGDIIGPIRSDIGFHILKINDIRDDIHNKNDNAEIKKVHLRHILLKPSPVLSDEKIHEKIEQIATDIKNGKITFTAAAKLLSEDPHSSKKGGDLGWVSLDLYNSKCREVIQKLKKGEISKPLHSIFGWQLIQLLDIQKVDKTYETQKERAYLFLLRHKLEEEKEKWMQIQRAHSYVKFLDTDDV